MLTVNAGSPKWAKMAHTSDLSNMQIIYKLDSITLILTTLAPRLLTPCQIQ